MGERNRFRGTLQHVKAHWPAYAALYGGIVAAMLVIGVSAQRGWLGLIPLATAVVLLLGHFLLASLWAAHQIYDRDGLRPHHVLFDMGGLRATDTFAFLDVGHRRRALSLSRRLTTGKIIIIDLYNPQLTTSRALVRRRRTLLHPPHDPRLVWREGNVNLLPLPDGSMSTVMLCQVASEFMQRGDRLSLLREVHRILRSNGRLLLAERARTQASWLTMGPAALTLETAVQWQTLLQEAGFIIRREENLRGLIHCIRADKPSATESRQLALELAFDA